MYLVSQSCSARSSASPRNSTIGACVCVLTRPGMTTWPDASIVSRPRNWRRMLSALSTATMSVAVNRHGARGDHPVATIDGDDDAVGDDERHLPRCLRRRDHGAPRAPDRATANLFICRNLCPCGADPRTLAARAPFAPSHLTLRSASAGAPRQPSACPRRVDGTPRRANPAARVPPRREPHFGAAGSRSVEGCPVAPAHGRNAARAGGGRRRLRRRRGRAGAARAVSGCSMRFSSCCRPLASATSACSVTKRRRSRRSATQASTRSRRQLRAR